MYWNHGTTRIAGEPELQRAEASWSGRLPRLARVLADLAGLYQAMSALPPVFIHGDCHTGNLLHSAGSLLFCDWLNAGTDRPQSDLAFLRVRATPSVDLFAALIDAYLAATAAGPELLRRAVLAEELTTLLLHWPPHAAANNAAGISRIVNRTRRVTDLWLDT